jgi:hypothetical protein
MPEFVLNRTSNLVAGGHNIRFTKGQPTYVPPELARMAIGMGAEPLDVDKDTLLPVDQAPVEELSAADKEILVFSSFDQIIARNDSKDFSGDGKPSVEAVKLIVGFQITKKEVVAMYQKYREQKAAEADA